MTKLTYFKIHSLLTVITFVVLFFSLYLQYRLGLQPCPLCLMQRLCVFLLLGLLGLSFASLRKAHLLSLAQAVISCAGLFFSFRQLWLQSLPPGSAPACMPGLDILIHYFPWQTVLKTLLWGAGDCAEVTWAFLGISIAGWTTLYFLFMAVTSILLFYWTKPDTPSQS